MVFNNCFYNANSKVVCVDNERLALLQFKQDLRDPANRLSSWVGENCCKWMGVICDNVTGRVSEIHLRNPYIKPVGDYETKAESESEYESEIDAYWRSQLRGKISPALLNLNHLEHLDLSCNHFEGIKIPGFIGSLKNLRYLNLSQSNFGGVIPYQLGNLSRLRYLSLDVAGASAENLQWLSGLPLLKHLVMSGVNLSKAFDWLKVTNNLPSLVELYLSNCELTYIPHLPNINFTSLAILDLSSNNFETMQPGGIFSLGSLVSLDLSFCQLYGSIPAVLRNMTSLRDLNLYYNYFNSTIPNWLYGFNHLEFLNFGFNSLQGELSSDVKNLTSLGALTCHTINLKGHYLDHGESFAT
ncbi:unnamed protein product [Ilex paraguariensis]|uniref:Leucine-rich repeat-containing N-terminal plant-type domain-containing protein n=1 Tax=Ilex paraguariensis TaxID=185542 RepID=A0ABC8QQU7_9AQUA